MYNHESYIKNHTSIRKAQKKYYNKNKSKICTKYSKIRKAWNDKHKAYLNEHAQLSAKIRKLESHTYTEELAQILDIVYANKEYLSDLHSRGLI